MAHNPIAKQRSRHVDIADHYAREQVEEKVVTITHVPTSDMVADVFTKPLGKSAFLKFQTKLVHDTSTTQ